MSRFTEGFRALRNATRASDDVAPALTRVYAEARGTTAAQAVSKSDPSLPARANALREQLLQPLREAQGKSSKLDALLAAADPAVVGKVTRQRAQRMAAEIPYSFDEKPVRMNVRAVQPRGYQGNRSRQMLDRSRLEAMIDPPGGGRKSRREMMLEMDAIAGRASERHASHGKVEGVPYAERVARAAELTEAERADLAASTPAGRAKTRRKGAQRIAQGAAATTAIGGGIVAAGLIPQGKEPDEAPAPPAPILVQLAPTGPAAPPATPRDMADAGGRPRGQEVLASDKSVLAPAPPPGETIAPDPRILDVFEIPEGDTARIEVLQAALNRIAERLDIAPLKEDGVAGEKTQAAITALSEYVGEPAGSLSDAFTFAVAAYDGDATLADIQEMLVRIYRREGLENPLRTSRSNDGIDGLYGENGEGGRTRTALAAYLGISRNDPFLDLLEQNSQRRNEILYSRMLGNEDWQEQKSKSEQDDNQ